MDLYQLCSWLYVVLFKSERMNVFIAGSFTIMNHDLHVTCIFFPSHAWTDWLVPNFLLSLHPPLPSSIPPSILHPSLHPSIRLDCGGAGFYPSSHWVRGRQAQMVCDTINMSNVPSDMLQLWPPLLYTEQWGATRGVFLTLSQFCLHVNYYPCIGSISQFWALPFSTSAPSFCWN